MQPGQELDSSDEEQNGGRTQAWSTHVQPLFFKTHEDFKGSADAVTVVAFIGGLYATSVLEAAKNAFKVVFRTWARPCRSVVSLYPGESR